MAKLNLIIIIFFVHSTTWASAISIDNGCLQIIGRAPSTVPYHTRDQLDRLEKWLRAIAALKFLEVQGRISFNRDQVLEFSPNLAFYNFGLATNCIRGLNSSYDLVLSSLNTRLKNESSSAAIRDAYAIIDNMSRDLGRNFRGVISTLPRQPTEIPRQPTEHLTDSPGGTAQ